MEELAVDASVSAEYSFAIEYRGPPVPFEIPRAIPIEVERIPVASVASVAAVATLPPNLDLPVIQPLPTPKKSDGVVASGTVVASPTSVIENRSAIDGETSGEIANPAMDPSYGGVDSSGPVEFSNDTGPNESGLSSEFESSEFSDEDETLAGKVNRPALVTFEPSGSASPAEEIGYRASEQKMKKGACYRCFRGSRFTEKEACLVCDAKYCTGCVLRAMGSMPEGRKCISCIGYPIEESKRERLGKCSRILKRLLSTSELELAMKDEKFCEANQLRPEHVCVNGKQLTMEEMVVLGSCPCPPTKLRPGHYWYDKVSGLWGKEGHKPHNFITPHLNVGGSLMRNSSHGYTGILINGREITKVELQMLKWAGVQCAGNPHFWVNADGTYQEEGQKNIKGHIWGKPGMKLVCSILSLPIPSKPANLSGKEVNKLVDRVVPDYLEQRALQKLLLVGYNGSGTSTIFKQARFLYRSNPFSEEERDNIKLIIQSNIYYYLGILLEGRERFEEESLSENRKMQSLCSLDAGNNEEAEVDDVAEYSLSPRLKSFSDWLLQVMASGNLEAIFPAATREYAPVVDELWNDAAIQATYRRRSELEMLPSVASYFLERVVDISRPEYEPSDTDILYADGITSSNGLACTDFLFPPLPGDADAAGQEQTRLRYQLIRVHTKSLGENCKWLDMFEEARLVIFCVSMSDYDEYYEDACGGTLNKMLESKRLFESIITHQTFDQMEFLLILTKFDLLEQKIDTAPLTLCDWFSDFNPVMSRSHPNNSRNQSNSATKSQMAFHYIAVKFKRLFAALTGRKLYVTLANGLDSDLVDAALRYAREILKFEEEKQVFNDLSAYSTEPSSFSQ